MKFKMLFLALFLGATMTFAQGVKGMETIAISCDVVTGSDCELLNLIVVNTDFTAYEMTRYYQDGLVKIVQLDGSNWRVAISDGGGNSAIVDVADNF